MLQILNKTKNNPPTGGLFLQKIKNKVLGQKYDLSLVLVDDKLSQKLNSRYRGKNRPANVLSFSLDKDVGEIFLNLKQARKEARQRNTGYKRTFISLFIHGLLHLKGYKHSEVMEKKEKQFLEKFTT